MTKGKAQEATVRGGIRSAPPKAKTPKSTTGIEVLENAAALKVGEIKNSVDMIINLDRVDTIKRMSSGTTDPVLKDPMIEYKYILPVGENVPGTNDPATTTKDPRSIMAAMKGHRLTFTNICEQTMYLDVKRPVASAHDDATAAARIDILQKHPLLPGKNYVYDIDMSYASVQSDDATAKIYLETLCLARAWRTDQLVDSLVQFSKDASATTQKVIDGDADCIRVTLETVYFGDTSGPGEGNYFALNFDQDFPDPGTLSGGPIQRTKMVKFANKQVGYSKLNRKTSISNFEYDVSFTGTGLGFDRVNSDRLGEGIYVMAVTNADDNQPWMPVVNSAWRDWIILVPAAGGYVWDENKADCPNLAGGAAVWSPADNAFVMWDFARNKPVTCSWGYTPEDGYGAFRYGSLPPKGEVQALPLNATTKAKMRGEAPKVAFTTVLLALSFLTKLVVLVAETAAAFETNVQVNRKNNIMLHTREATDVEKGLVAMKNQKPAARSAGR